VGERLTLLSDGVVEASNPKGELYGFERTLQMSNQTAAFIAETAKEFGQADDITVVTVSRIPKIMNQNAAGNRAPSERDNSELEG
jgi:serine phosphatase RsbU (regulator of sigma subunit)